MKADMKKQTKYAGLVVCVCCALLAAMFTACSEEPGSPKKCTVSFALGYITKKTPPASITVDAGTAAGSLFPGTPARPTWDFTGWKDSSGKAYTRTTVINDNVVLTASWNFFPGPANPFLTDRFTTDPAAFIDDDGTVYIVCGEDTLPPVHDSNEYFRMPQWHIYSTTDMKTFQYEDVLLKANDFSFGRENSAWAAQAIKGLDGLYYFYGTVLLRTTYEQVICVATAPSPTGPWTPVQTPLIRSQWVLQDTGSTSENIDPTVFIDDDGAAYVSWSQVTPRIARLKDNMTEIERPIKKLFPDDWKSDDRYEEGPFLYKRNGIYYMIYASMKVNANGGAIAETISYSMAKPDGSGKTLGSLWETGEYLPWTPGVTITGHAPEGANGQGNSYTIHPAILEFKGQGYLFYHNETLTGVVQPDGSVWNGGDARRSLAVDYLYFNEDGTIQFIDVRDQRGISVPPKDE